MKHVFSFLISLLLPFVMFARNVLDIEEIINKFEREYGVDIPWEAIELQEYSNTVMIICIAGLITYVIVMRRKHYVELSDIKDELDAKGFLFIKKSAFGGGKLIHDENLLELEGKEALHHGWATQKMKFKDILYIEADDKQTVCYVRNEDSSQELKKLVMNDAYKKVLEIFGNRFLEVQRGVAVHKRYIQGEASLHARMYQLKLGFDKNLTKIIPVSDRNISKVKASMTRINIQ